MVYVLLSLAHLIDCVFIRAVALDKQRMNEMLLSLSFEPKYIERAFKVYDRLYGGPKYAAEVMTEIIVRLQKRDTAKNNAARVVSSPRHVVGCMSLTAYKDAAGQLMFVLTICIDTERPRSYTWTGPTPDYVMAIIQHLVEVFSGGPGNIHELIDQLMTSSAFKEAISRSGDGVDSTSEV